MSGAPSTGRRVAFFGGSFDPPHLGHLAVARAACAALRLDTVLFAPVGAQPLKPQGSTAPFEDRLAMTHLAIAADQAFSISLADAPQPSGRPNYTLDTLLALSTGLPPGSALFCLMGADSFASLKRWHRAAEIPFAAPLIVASRPGENLHDLKASLPDGLSIEAAPKVASDSAEEHCSVNGQDHSTRETALPGTIGITDQVFAGRGKALSGKQEVSGHDFSRAAEGTKINRALAPEGILAASILELPGTGSPIQLLRYILTNPAGQTAPLHLLPGLQVDISASEIRGQIRANATAPALLPPSVSAYIRAHGLYR